MKQNNKLNKALKDALHEHTEPLYEAQWDRLSMALGEQKKKRRFLPWFFLLFFATVTGLFACYLLGGYEGIQSSQVAHQEKNEAKGNSRHPAYGHEQDNPNHQNLSEQTNHQSIEKNKETLSGVDPAVQNLPGKDRVKKGRTRESSGNQAGIYTVGNSRPERMFSGPAANMMREEVPPDGAISLLSIHGLRKINAWNYVDSLPLRISMAELEPVKRIKPPGPNRDMAKFAIGVSSGISPVRFSIGGIQHEEKLHKDTRAIYAESNKYSRSYYGNFNFEWLLSGRIPVFLSTGVQYRQIIQDVNLSYELKEIVFRDSLGNILTYIPAINPLVFEYKQKNYLDFISIPVKISYLMPIGGRNELLFSGGLNISALVKTRGSTFSVNEVDFKPLKQSYKGKLNAGIAGGLQYNRNIYKAFWLGFEAQWQRNTMNSDVQYGVIRNRISISNYNIQLKYKF